MKNLKPLPIIIIIAIIAVLAFSIAYFKFFVDRIPVVLEKQEYRAGEDGKVKIANNSGGKICFSSCYPFYFEKEAGGEWKAENYSGCKKEDLAEKCLDQNSIKAFQFVFPGLESGQYRLAIPVCDSCNEGDKFIRSKWIYSNNFKIIL